MVACWVHAPNVVGSNPTFTIMFKLFWSDSPLNWQTYLHDPASISMEGILTFNKHLLFLVIVIVLFVGWIIFFTVYYFFRGRNKVTIVRLRIQLNIQRMHILQYFSYIYAWQHHVLDG